MAFKHHPGDYSVTWAQTHLSLKTGKIEVVRLVDELGTVLGAA